MKKILFALCLLLFASCTRDVVLVLPPVSPRLVLNASVSPDTDVTAFLSQKLVCLGHGYGRRGRGWQHTSVYKRPFARMYAARFR